uniref:MFS domain-containing protein n=1 Tax=Globodera pallida TaxID=36090 RepID=A0A183CKJ1_GLOPA
MHYNAFITVASNLIATHLPPNGAYGLVFGINGFVGVLLQALITLLVVDANGPFALTIEAQFATYSAYFAATSFLLPLLKLSMRRCST